MIQKEKLSIASSQAAPCPCGCAPCEETTCSLDCIIRPRYFCGQLLSEADLNAGLAWNQNKFRLSRRREGWGVACGLEVSCGPQPGLVTIAPGYAVDCCGDDIVVCAETTLDINKLLQQPPAQCDPTTGKSRVSVGKTVKAGDWVIVDVSIAYAEENIIPTTTLGRAACGQASACEYSRAKESYTLNAVEVARFSFDELRKWQEAERVKAEEIQQQAGMAKEAPAAKQKGAAAVEAVPVVIKEPLRHRLWGLGGLRGPDPLGDAYERWIKEVVACLNSVKNLNLQDGISLADLQKGLAAWHANHPCYQFCYLDGFYTAPESQLETWMSNNILHDNYAKYRYPLTQELVFLSMQDCFHHFVAKGCPTCDNVGVPIARVWLTTTVSQNKAVYTVNQISGIPPFRREQQPDRLPAYSGAVNLGEVIWRNPYEAAMKLDSYGVHLDMRQMDFVTLDTFDQVYDLFDPQQAGGLLLFGGMTYTPRIYMDRFNFMHLVGATPADVPVREVKK